MTVGQNTINMEYTLGIYTLGCKVNQYESEAIVEAAENAGFTICDPSERCDVYIINTCTVTGESDRKSRQFIRRAISENASATVIVTGCLTQVSADSVASIEGVDYICGCRDKLRTVDAALSLVGREKLPHPIIEVDDLTGAGFENMSIKSFPRTRAYIKIEDGCESSCTYCIIPRARGSIRSKPAKDVLCEVARLKESGCREVVLTGIETAAYGREFGDGYRLAELLSDVDEIAGADMRIRLGSLDPSLFRKDFVTKIAHLGSIAPHFHLSMQSGSSSVLARMKRRYNADMALEGIELLKTAIPDVQLTCDIIVGFPGETEDEFSDTLDFMKKVGFLDAHIFSYSRREGTPAASMEGQVPPDIKHERSARLISAQREITYGILDGMIGKTLPVLFEARNGELFTGHTASFVEVGVKCSEDLHATLADVRITGRQGGICLGELIV